MWRISPISQKQTQMTLGDLIKTSSWLSVESVFSKLFPNQVTFLDDYNAVFNELKGLKPTKSNISIIIETVIDDFDNEEYVSVSGYNNPKGSRLNDEITASLALEFTSWSEWLGMTIDNDSAKNFSQYEIICHCLHEMTFMGFDQKAIENKWQKIIKAEQEFKQMSKEEKERNTWTLDELLKKSKTGD